MTKAQAIKMAESRWWIGLDARTVASFQLFEDLLCMNFGDFYQAMEEALGRPVFTHEFGMNRDGLQQELLGGKPAPTLEEIVNMIPAEKRILAVVDGD